MSQFDDCTAFILQEEGGYSNDPRDPGGATNFGITIGDLQAWRGRKATVTPADVRGMSKSEALLIYGARYWSPLSCALLPAGVDLIVYNFGVNAGVPNVAREVQGRVGVDRDGFLGPLTATAARGADRETLMRGLLADEADYYRSLAEFPIYGHGWLGRLDRCAALAWKMAAMPSVPPVLSATAAPPPAPAFSEADQLDSQFNSGE